MEEFKRGVSDGPNHLGSRHNVLPAHHMALIASGCVPWKVSGRIREAKLQAVIARRATTTTTTTDPPPPPLAAAPLVCRLQLRLLLWCVAYSCGCSQGEAAGAERIRRDEDDGAGPPQHGLSSEKMGLITSDNGKMCSLHIAWP